MSTIERELPKQYDHAAAQERWYAYWEEQGYFHSEPDSSRKPFTIVIPPPNVTGALHLGHALNNTLQDICIRSKRMQGYNALWMPGTDHAGIATQAVVERRLLEEQKLSRHDLGREKLVERIWAWKEQYEKRIIGQLKQMGCSCDWQRTRFTLDDVCARAVRQTFFEMFKRGLIYRGKRLVNWDTFLQTAVSDDEVFHETVKGHFWYFRYPVIDPKPGEPTHVLIATTRPETMLGDTAVAVHPDPAKALDAAEKELKTRLAAAAEKEKADLQKQIDEVQQRRRTLLPELVKLRDMALAGRQVMLPLLNRPIPLVADEWAKPELGTGCVKITPAHDPNDYQVGQRRGLPMINILNPDGTLNDAGGPYARLTMRDARKRVVADMEAAELVERIEDREIDLAHSDRSKTPIEPYLADQWFVKMDHLAQSAMDAVTEGQVKISPERYAKSYLDWLGEKRDWPVSRQLWWGHRIPVWSRRQQSADQPISKDSEIIKTLHDPDVIATGWLPGEGDHEGTLLVCIAPGNEKLERALEKAGVQQDPDVLDTWFSSALWPHSTLGWPEKTPELAYYYPTSVLITSRDIITLWVARMVLTGLFNVGDVPFRQVYIHPKILDGYGETMSKSKGNGVDPIDVIEKFGADSLRFGLAYMATETQDVRMPVEFECPHCQETFEQTKKNRVLPVVECPKCHQRFSTQWAAMPEDQALPRGAVVSERFELARNFCNKLWNVSKLVITNLDGYTPGPVADEDLALEDRWLLSRLATVTDEVTQALDTYRFADAARALYDFTWSEYCSYYAEIVKPRLSTGPAGSSTDRVTGSGTDRVAETGAEPQARRSPGGDSDEAQRQTAQRIFVHALDVILRLLHPMIPFLTEEVWQLLNEVAPTRGLPVSGRALAPGAHQAAAASIMVAPWPAANLKQQDPTIEARFARFQAVLGGLREIRSRQNIAPKAQIEFVARCDADTVELLRPMAPYFASMAGATATAWGPSAVAPAVTAHTSLPGIELYVDLTGLIDVDAEQTRGEKEEARLIQMIGGKEQKLSNEAFVARAPADVVAKERASLADLQEQLNSVRAMLAALRKPH